MSRFPSRALYASLLWSVLLGILESHSAGAAHQTTEKTSQELVLYQPGQHVQSQHVRMAMERAINVCKQSRNSLAKTEQVVARPFIDFNIQLYGCDCAGGPLLPPNECITLGPPICFAAVCAASVYCINEDIGASACVTFEELPDCTRDQDCFIPFFFNSTAGVQLSWCNTTSGKCVQNVANIIFFPRGVNYILDQVTCQDAQMTCTQSCDCYQYYNINTTRTAKMECVNGLCVQREYTPYANCTTDADCDTANCDICVYLANTTEFKSCLRVNDFASPALTCQNCYATSATDCTCIQNDQNCYEFVNGSCQLATDCGNTGLCTAPGVCSAAVQLCFNDAECNQQTACSKCLPLPLDPQFSYCRVITECANGCNMTAGCQCNTPSNPCQCIANDNDCYTLSNGTCIKTTDCAGLDVCVGPGQCTIDYDPCGTDSDCSQVNGCRKCLAFPTDPNVRYCRLVESCTAGCNIANCSCIQPAPPQESPVPPAEVPVAPVEPPAEVPATPMEPPFMPPLVPPQEPPIVPLAPPPGEPVAPPEEPVAPPEQVPTEPPALVPQQVPSVVPQLPPLVPPVPEPSEPPFSIPVAPPLLVPSVPALVPSEPASPAPVAPPQPLPSNCLSCCTKNRKRRIYRIERI